jgi:HAD superfamily hydrolase (TIGR01509 family)
MQLRAVLFDFDGTLVSSMAMYVRIFGECLAEQGVTPGDPETIRHFAFQSLEVIFEKLAKILDVEQFKASFLVKELALNTHEHLPLVIEVPSLLSWLKSQNLKVAIVSSKLRRPIEELIQQYEIAEHIDLVIGRDDVTATKPDPEPILHACDLLGCEPHDTLYVGDTLVDLTATREAGSTFVGVLTGACTRQDFEKAKADYIVTHAGEVAEIVRNLLDKNTNSK